MRKLLILLFFLQALNVGISQSSNWAKVQDQNLVELRLSLKERPALSNPNLYLISPIWASGKSSMNQPANLAAAPIPAAWRYQDLAFFCKLEVKMEKALNLPIKFRLGEVQTVERMEGKLKTHFEGRQ